MIGSGHDGNIAASRAYGAVAGFRVRTHLIEEAAEVYFKFTKDVGLQEQLKELLDRAVDFSARRNEIAHGVVNPHIIFRDGTVINKGWVLYPAYYATKKRTLPEDEPLTNITPTYV